MRLLYAPEIDSQCRATIATQSCTVRLATVKYSVIRKGTSGALDHTRYPQTLARQLIVANASSNDGAPAVTLAALEYFGHYFLQSSATVTQPKTPSDECSWEPSGVLSRQYASFRPTNISCGFRWDNATDDLIWALHDVMFRMAIASSYGKSWSVSQDYFTPFKPVLHLTVLYRKRDGPCVNMDVHEQRISV
jgi:hypothetical protein